jgi:hypothetical protein
VWSSWVKEKGTTQVMYIAELKDSPKRVKKTFSMTLKRVFEIVWWRGGGNGITSKRIFEVEVVFSSQNIDFPFYLKRLLELSFFLLLLFMLHLFLLRTQEFWWYLRRKSLLHKLLFKWPQYTGDGCIFWSGVMHANMAKPWLWRCGSCGYIGSRCTVRSGVIHANIFWVRLAIFFG